MDAGVILCRLMWPAITGVILSSLASLEVGFCDAATGEGFFSEQPSDQLERWEKPFDNGTHLVIDWFISPWMSGRNVSSYHVDVSTSVPVLNIFVGQFGGFPQDLCAPGGSKAKDAVNAEGSLESTCMPYEKDAHLTPRRTSFEVPAALRAITRWDIVVTVRGYGSCAPVGKPDQAVPCYWWCHKYQKAQRSKSSSPSAPAVSAAAAAVDGAQVPRREGPEPPRQRFAQPVISAVLVLHSHVAGALAKLTGGPPPPVNLCYGKRC